MGEEKVTYLQVGNEADRVTIASILYKNGYSVSPVRKKKNGRSFEYYIAYWKAPTDIPDSENVDEG